jgi:hypothetical protein
VTVEVDALVANSTKMVDDLAGDAEQYVRISRIISQTEQERLQKWIESIKNAKISELRKRQILCYFIVTKTQPRI